ncbi:MAG: hypothetical protein ACXAB7_13705 [Candidatus Kariarchaeaceae archaeon]
MERKTLNFENKQLLFDFWEQLPIVKEIDSKEQYLVEKSEIRDAIIKILSTGVESSHPETNEMRIRFALSAKEIFNEVKQRLPSSKIVLQNIYFHIEKLENHGFLQVITSLSQGKRLTSYYGRTSRMVLLRTDDIGDDKKEYAFLQDEGLIALIQQISPKVSREQIEQSLISLDRLNKNSMNSFREWAESNKSAFRESSVDNESLFKLYNVIIRFNANVCTGLSELAKLMKIDIKSDLNS